MSVYSDQRYEIRHKAARLAEGDGFLLGVVAAGAGSGTIICNLTGWSHDDDFFSDWAEVFNYSTGETGNPTDWATATGTLTFAPAGTPWSEAETIEMHQVFTVAEYNTMIDIAIEMIASNFLQYNTDETLALNNVLSNWYFGYDSGLTGWTDNACASAARSTDMYMAGPYSAKTVSDGTNACSISQAFANYEKYRDEPYNLSCLVQCDTADRVRLALVDGVETKYSSYHQGEGKELLYINDILGANATDCTVQLRTEFTAGDSAVTGYFGACTLCFDRQYEYDLPTTFAYVHRIEIESNIRDKYDTVVPHDAWRILPETTQKIWFNPDLFTPMSGRRMRIHGTTMPAVMTADSDQTPVNPAWLAFQVAALLHRSRVRGRDNDSEDYKAQAKEFQDQADALKYSINYQLPAGSKPVTRI